MRLAELREALHDLACAAHRAAHGDHQRGAVAGRPRHVQVVLLQRMGVARAAVNDLPREHAGHGTDLLGCRFGVWAYAGGRAHVSDDYDSRRAARSDSNRWPGGRLQPPLGSGHEKRATCRRNGAAGERGPSRPAPRRRKTMGRRGIRGALGPLGRGHDVLVLAEEILLVVLRLEPGEPGVVRAVRALRHPLRLVFGHEVHVHAADRVRRHLVE